MYSDYLKKFDKVALVTGATGLIGRSVVKKLQERGIGVVAQGFSSVPESYEGCVGIRGDFSSPESIRDFIKKNRELLNRCNYLVNNYGPLIWKQSKEVSTEDFLSDFYGNFVAAVELTVYMLKCESFEGSVSLGFDKIGQMMAYKKILSYGVAKNALLLYIESMRLEWKDIFFSIVSPSTVKGAEFESAGSKPVDAMEVAELISDCIEKRENRNFIIDHNGIRV